MIATDSDPTPEHKDLHVRTPASRLATIMAWTIAVMLVSATTAGALSFQADFRNSTYDTQVGDTFSDLLAQHQSETLIQANVTTGLEGISTAAYAGGVNRDYSILLSTTLDVGTNGTYTFQVGTDWGRGGATALIDNSTGSIVSERVIDDDVWWANDWTIPTSSPRRSISRSAIPTR